MTAFDAYVKTENHSFVLLQLFPHVLFHASFTHKHTHIQNLPSLPFSEQLLGATQFLKGKMSK